MGRSLQRVQGRDRLALEEHRRRARVAARIEALEVQRARYEQRQRAEEQVLRSPDRTSGVQAEELVGPPPPADANDPFMEDEEPTPAPPRETDTAPASPPPPADVVDTPAPADPASPPPVAADPNDPFGGPPASSDPAPALDDPFGAPPPANDAPAPSDDPFGDPFGN